MSRLYLRVYLALIAVVVAFFASSSLLFFWHRGGTREDALLGTAAQIAALVLPAPEAPPEQQSRRVSEISTALGAGVALLDDEGRRLAEAGPLAPLPDLGRAESHRAGGLRHDALLLHLADGRWLSLRLPPAPHEHGGFFVSLALLAGLLGLVAYPLARWLARRVEALTARVDAFGRGELSARAEVAGHDEVARLAASFNQAASRIESLVATQRTLLASASHALRSPLARLRVAAELLAGEPSAERAAELREQLAREVSSLDAAVEELLAVSRLELGGASPSPVDLLALAAEEGARVGAEVTGAPAELLGDARSLRHLLRNLLDNARRHAAGSLVELCVTPIDATRADSGARIQVSDRGPGISEAERERIFEPFTKGSSSVASGDSGVGLGLAIVRQIARHHGGEACARPREGGGSVFEVMLPGRPAGWDGPGRDVR